MNRHICKLNGAYDICKMYFEVHIKKFLFFEIDSSVHHVCLLLANETNLMLRYYETKSFGALDKNAYDKKFYCKARALQYSTFKENTQVFLLTHLDCKVYLKNWQNKLIYDPKYDVEIQAV